MKVWYVTFPIVLVIFALWLWLTLIGFITFDEMVIYGFACAGIFFAEAATIVLEERRIRQKKERKIEETGIPPY